MPYREVELVERAQNGDRAAFSDLYERYQQTVHTFIYYRVSDQSTAEELTAKVFVRMVEKIEQYRHRGKPFLAWLYTIARNLLTDYYRQGGMITLLPLDEKLSANINNPVAVTEKKLLADCLRLALQHLTAEQQDVIIGKFIENRSNADIADLMGKNVGSIKSLQHRALAALRRAIAKEGCYEP
ncbi:MAG: sigma-70 family RNA polymerase sigma factor [Candidatus Promineifilaceae bacterium]